MSSAFPLLRLPDEALHRVIQCMEYIELVGFSLVSNKTKEIVRSFNSNIARIWLTVNDIIRIHLHSYEDAQSSMVWSFYPEENDIVTEPFPVYIPAHVIATTERSYVRYENPGLSIREWIEHVQYIFSIEEINNISFGNETCKFNWISLKDAVGKFKIHALLFDRLCSLECAQTAMRHFSMVRCVTAFCPSFNDPSLYRDILIQNLDQLTLGDEDMLLEIGLDDLLLMNCKDITIRSPRLKGKMINQFLKHWIGGSNPRLEIASFYFVNHEVVNKDILFKGLNYQEVEREDEEVEDYDIFRSDGTVISIAIEQTDRGCCVVFQIFE